MTETTPRGSYIIDDAVGTVTVHPGGAVFEASKLPDPMFNRLALEGLVARLRRASDHAAAFDALVAGTPPKANRARHNTWHDAIAHVMSEETGTPHEDCLEKVRGFDRKQLAKARRHAPVIARHAVMNGAPVPKLADVIAA